MNEPQPTSKQLALSAIFALEDDASIDDAIEALLPVLRIQRGLADADAGRTIPHEEVKRRFAQRVAEWHDRAAPPRSEPPP